MNVVVRVRPPMTPTAKAAPSIFDPLELSQLVTCVDDGKSIAVLKDSTAASCTASTFTFASVFNPEQSTDAVYDGVLAPIVRNVLKGTPGCIFAFGQTGSGKTHTVTGDGACPGLLRLAVADMLKRTEGDSDVVTSCVHLSYLEVYNEVIRDLLNPATGGNLQLLEHKGCPALPGMTKIPVASVEDAVGIVDKGEAYRAKGANKAHEHASRSHAIFTITVETRRVDEPDVRVGVLHVVDLAGSETAVPPNTTTSQDCREVIQKRQALGDIANACKVNVEAKKAETRNREGCHIRRSLLALVSCVTKLADKAAFVPYRDSKLTRLLRPALEGNANTAIVCTINPMEGKETTATLRFAATAQRIHRTPATTSVVSAEGSMLRSYERQISMLKVEMNRSVEEERRRGEVLKAAKDSTEAELQRSAEERDQLHAKVKSLNQVLLTSALSRRIALPTPREVAKTLLYADSHQGLRRSGSAPHRRGSVLREAHNAVSSVPQPAPQWLKDGSLSALRGEVDTLAAENTALRQHLDEASTVNASALESANAEIAALRAQLLAANALVAKVDQDRQAVAAEADQHRKKGSGMCTGPSAVKGADGAGSHTLRPLADLRREAQLSCAAVVVA
jgi:centromeric protein E